MPLRGFNMAISDRQIDEINESIVDSMNDLGALDMFLEDDPDGSSNTVTYLALKSEACR